MPAGKNAVEAERIDTELVITRIFDAPRELVFRAWTDPSQMLRWMGPRDYPAIHAELDVRPGGLWRACLRSTRGGGDLWQGGRYREVVPPERLVYTFAWGEGHPTHGSETLVSVTLAERGGKTEMVFRQTMLPSIAERDGHRLGWSNAFDRLDDALRLLQA